MRNDMSRTYYSVFVSCNGVYMVYYVRMHDLPWFSAPPTERPFVTMATRAMRNTMFCVTIFVASRLRFDAPLDTRVALLRCKLI